MLQTVLFRGHRWLKPLLLCVLFGASAGASAMDTYDPATGILTIPMVIVGDAAYTNVQVFVPLAHVLSVGGVDDPNAALDAADDYSIASGQLTIGAVQVGNTIYSNVVVLAALSDVRAVGAVMSTPVAPWMALVDPLAPATVGQPYAANVVSVVAPPSRYTFGIDTLANGVLPTGMTIDLNGKLSGTPFATGRTDINGQQIANMYTFGVCATDTFTRATTSPCPTTSITVNPAAPPPVVADAVSPAFVQLGHAGSCTGGVLSTRFHVAAANGITWSAAADFNTPPLGGKPLGVAPVAGNGAGDVLVTVTVPPQLPSSSYSNCSLTYNLATFSNVYVTFSDGAIIGVTVSWTFVGTT
jgi:hypothetical protein